MILLKKLAMTGYIKFIGIHKEYDKIKNIKNI